MMQRTTAVAVGGATIRIQLEGAVMGSQHEQIIVERVKLFLRWQGERFDDLEGEREPLADSFGWHRNDEFWIKPATWLETIFEGDEAAARDGARLLRDIGLLRTQAGSSLQINAKVRGAVLRAYAVDRAILEWRAVTSSGSASYNQSRAWPSNPEDAPPHSALVSQDAAADLATRLERGVSRALDEALDILNTKVGRDDRAYQAILRAKSTIVNTLVSAQIRVDEHKLRARQTDELLPALLESLKIEKEKLAKVNFRRTFDDAEPSAMGMGAAPEEEPSA